MGGGDSGSDRHGAPPMSLEGLRRELEAAVRIEDETDRLMEVAAIVEEALNGIGVTAVVVGGLAVAYWTRTRYTTAEIDFVMPVTEEVRQRVADLGFEKPAGRHWIYPGSDVQFEIPGDFLEGGDEPEEVRSKNGRRVRLISLEDMVLWRTREFLHWKDSRGVRHAIYMLESPRLDWERLKARAAESGLTEALNWIVKAAEEIKKGREFEDWEIKKAAERLEKNG
jgi:hypothetical protein